MLEPRDRRLLLDALRPPPGYRLDAAVGTTYSLDLLSLMTVPLAFSFFDLADDRNTSAPDDPVEPDPMALLHAVSNHAERITLFCQAGEIAIPRHYRGLLAYLENSVIEVTPRSRHRVFHPKVWLLRFTGAEGPVCYRLLVLTRNLTFDRSWDAMLVLDGELTQRKNAIALNHPLGDFIAALPGLAVRPLPPATAATVERMQHEVRRVQFTPLADLDIAAFWPLGLGRANPWPFKGRADRMLIISPFLSPQCLDRMVNGRGSHVLISRVDSLAGLDEQTRSRFGRLYVLHDAADPEPADTVTNGPVLSGLHAKVYVADAGWDARVWVGSANATDAAFSGNIEFMVELKGKKGRCGVDAVLGEGADGTGVAGLLAAYTAPPEPPDTDATAVELERQLQMARRALAVADLAARVRPLAEGYMLEVHSTGEVPLNLPSGVEVTCRPITLQEHAAVPVNNAPAAILATFGPISVDAITAFIAVRLRASDGERTVVGEFVLNLPLTGAPADRHQQILRRLLGSREQVLRYLLFLLAADGDAGDVALAGALPWQLAAGPSNGAAGGTADFPLLEALIRTLHRDPGKLDQVARVVADLQATPGGRALLPEGLAEVWPPIWAARQGVTA